MGYLGFIGEDDPNRGSMAARDFTNFILAGAWLMSIGMGTIGFLHYKDQIMSGVEGGWSELQNFFVNAAHDLNPGNQ